MENKESMLELINSEIDKNINFTLEGLTERLKLLHIYESLIKCGTGKIGFDSYWLNISHKKTKLLLKKIHVVKNNIIKIRYLMINHLEIKNYEKELQRIDELYTKIIQLMRYDIRILGNKNDIDLIHKIRKIGDIIDEILSYDTNFNYDRYKYIFIRSFNKEFKYEEVNFLSDEIIIEITKILELRKEHLLPKNKVRNSNKK